MEVGLQALQDQNGTISRDLLSQITLQKNQQTDIIEAGQEFAKLQFASLGTDLAGIKSSLVPYQKFNLPATIGTLQDLHDKLNEQNAMIKELKAWKDNMSPGLLCPVPAVKSPRARQSNMLHGGYQKPANQESHGLEKELLTRTLLGASDAIPARSQRLQKFASDLCKPLLEWADDLYRYAVEYISNLVPDGESSSSLLLSISRFGSLLNT